MTEKQEDFNSIQQESIEQLSAKELKKNRFQPRTDLKTIKRPPLREQRSRAAKNAVKIKPTQIPVHFTWSLVLTILCFFLIGPFWTLYKTVQLRRMIQRQEIEKATRLSSRITTILIVLTILGIFVWVAILFCTAGLALSGALIKSGYI